MVKKNISPNSGRGVHNKMLMVLIAFLLCGCLNACTSGLTESTVPTPVPVSKSTRADSIGYEDAKALWDSHRVVNYDMTISYEPSGFLEPARVVLVKVRNSAPESIEVPDKTDKRGRLGFYDPYKTVESMFSRIENLRQRSGLLTVRYDEIYGHPKEIKYSEPSPDSSFTFRVLEFRPVTTDGS